MDTTFQTVEIASVLLSALPRLRPSVAVVLAKFAAGETSELCRRLRGVGAGCGVRGVKCLTVTVDKNQSVKLPG
jgi:hypothetical protein